MIWSVAAIKAMPEFAQMSDEQVQLNLDAAEQMIHSLTANAFCVRGAAVDAASYEGRLMGIIPNAAEGDTVIVTETAGVNDGLYTVTGVDSLTGETELDRQLQHVARNRVTLVRYPADVRLGVLNMLRWDKDNRSKAGIKSESISRHSVTYADGSKDSVGGYPPETIAFLKPYTRARF